MIEDIKDKKTTILVIGHTGSGSAHKLLLKKLALEDFNISTITAEDISKAETIDINSLKEEEIIKLRGSIIADPFDELFKLRKARKNKQLLEIIKNHLDSKDLSGEAIEKIKIAHANSCITEHFNNINYKNNVRTKLKQNKGYKARPAFKIKRNY